MKLKRKLIISLVVTIALSIWSGIKDIDEFFIILGMLWAMYLAGTLVFKYMKWKIRSSGGFFSWFLSVTDTTKYDKQVMDWAWDGFERWTKTGAYSYLQREEAERAAKRNQALNEAKYHEYYAKRNAGTYDGYRSANRARAARNRANNY